MYCFKEIITINPSMLENIEKAKEISNAMFPVLIYGETGTGKELFAQAIHCQSCVNDNIEKPFVAQNCSNIPEAVFESILWGVEKGAYTGAIEKPGLFEEAEGGTLFLDEINSLPLHLQAKLLRVLENQKVLRVGSSKARTVKTRIITAMNDTPQRVLKENIIRKDLFFRLATGTIQLTPLRNRPEDIQVYIDTFISEFNMAYNKALIGVDREVKKYFNGHCWQGNVREIRNVLESACCVAKGNVLTMKDIPEYFLSLNATLTEDGQIVSGFEGELRDPNKEFVAMGQNMLKADFTCDNLEATVAAFEKEIIKKALERNQFHITKTAKSLGIPRQTLKYKADRYNLII